MTGHTPKLWSRNGFNLCEIIRIEEGPAPDGKTYADGRHQIHVATFARIEDAATAERAVNRDHAFDDLVSIAKQSQVWLAFIANTATEETNRVNAAALMVEIDAALAKAGSAQPQTETA